MQRSVQNSEASVFVPGFALALRETAQAAEDAVGNAPYASNMVTYIRGISDGLEERGFEILKGRNLKSADLVARARGYVVALKVSPMRLARSSVERFTDVRADYRIVVLRDWFQNDHPTRNISGVDKVITPFLGGIKRGKLLNITDYNTGEEVAENINEDCDFPDYSKPEPSEAVAGTTEFAKNVSKLRRNPRARAGAPTRAHACAKDPKSDHKRDQISLSQPTEVSLASLEKTSSGAMHRKSLGLRSARPRTCEQRSGEENYKSVDLEKMARARSEVHERMADASRQQRASKRRRHAVCRIDWSELDQAGRPVLSFDPADPRRSRLLEILGKDARDRTHQACVRKLGQEFSRIYERYRTVIARRSGQTDWCREFDTERQRRYCERVGVFCVKAGVTPRQVIEFWHRNIKNHTDGRLTVPPVSFLASLNAIDTVVCALAKPEDSQPTLRTVTDKNPYADLSKFDPRLRRMLEEAGFDTTKYNDRYLLSVQHSATAMARGADLLVGDGQFGKMICAAADWYREQMAVAS